MPSNILAIETATNACSVALQVGTEIITEHHVIEREHNKILLKHIASVLAQAQLNLIDLDALTVGIGPGSFVGVRIGVGVAQGLAFGADLPIVPFSTLQVLAQTAYQQHNVSHAAVCLDARKDDVYLGCFREQNGLMQSVQDEAALPPEAIHLPENQKWQAIGEGWGAYSNRLPELPAVNFDEALLLLLPQAQAMLPLAQAAFSAGNSVSPEWVQPVYLRGVQPWASR